MWLNSPAIISSLPLALCHKMRIPVLVSGFLCLLLHLGASQKLPTVLIATLVRNKAHTLPYFLSSIERLDYPKERLSIWWVTCSWPLRSGPFDSLCLLGSVPTTMKTIVSRLSRPGCRQPRTNTTVSCGTGIQNRLSVDGERTRRASFTGRKSVSGPWWKWRRRPCHTLVASGQTMSW